LTLLTFPLRLQWARACAIIAPDSGACSDAAESAGGHDLRGVLWPVGRMNPETAGGGVLRQSDYTRRIKGAVVGPSGFPSPDLQVMRATTPTGERLSPWDR